ncbi:MAG: RNA polymerase sigma-70 factor (ECF subfamily) [Saprospiraceae bacterium]|jgi:RNA polymerase sigma-70 factor (ECF subfamily)
MSEENTRDKALLENIRKGDKPAFRKLFDMYYQILLATAINLLKDVNLAKDVVQEVFFQIWKKREEIIIESSMSGYLKRAVINRSINQIKSRKKMVSENHFQQMHSNQPSVTEDLETQHLNEVLQKALDSLPERCRLVFVMRRMEGMSHKEIAEKLNISPKTIENQITKALKTLKIAIQPHVQEKLG